MSFQLKGCHRCHNYIIQGPVTHMSGTRINNVYLSSLKISISKLNAMHLSQLSHPRPSLHSGWHISRGDQCKIDSTSRVEHNLVWFSDPLFQSQMGTMSNMTTILVPHIKLKWWCTSVASAGPSSASMRATKAHHLKHYHKQERQHIRKIAQSRAQFCRHDST